MLENRIDRITVKNFRSLKQVSVELDDLTVLVGPNGSGKSNFLDVLSLVRDALRVSLQYALVRSRGGGHPHILHFSQTFTIDFDTLDDIEIEIELTLKGVQGSFSFALQSTNSITYGIKRETIKLGNDRFESRDGVFKESTIPLQPPLQSENFTFPLIGGLPHFATLYEYLVKMQFFSVFQADILSFEAQWSEIPDHHAKSLANVLAGLDQKSTDEIGYILSKVVPGISEVDTFVFGEIGSASPRMGLRHHFGDLLLHQESTGTLHFLALLAALYQRPAPTLMAFEEPELFIHPPATSYLTELMEEASLRGQVIVSTHSPDFIANFPPESLRVFEMVDGATQISPLRGDQMQTIKDGIFDGGDLLRYQGLKGG